METDLIEILRIREIYILARKSSQLDSVMVVGLIVDLIFKAARSKKENQGKNRE